MSTKFTQNELEDLRARLSRGLDDGAFTRDEAKEAIKAASMSSISNLLNEGKLGKKSRPKLSEFLTQKGYPPREFTTAPGSDHSLFLHAAEKFHALANALADTTLPIPDKGLLFIGVITDIMETGTEYKEKIKKLVKDFS